MKTSPPPTSRILLAQLYANGDCLLATTIARQIKQDFPGCHLTWAISSRCCELLRDNPDVDATWIFEQVIAGHPAEQDRINRSLWAECEQAARQKLADRAFDHIFLPFSGGFRHLHLYDGTVRGLLFGAYPHPVTVPVAPVLRLDGQEIERVRGFVAARPVMTRRRRVALFECSPKSLQSSVNPAFALELSRRLLAEFDDLCIILSSNLAVATPDERIIDASGLSFRENAELTKYCTLLIGCSSGLTWLSTSEAAKRLPTVQMLSSTANVPNSLAIDHERRGLPTAEIIEMIDPDIERAFACLVTVLREGFGQARVRFHERLSLLHSYRCIARQLLRTGHYLDTASYIWRVWRVEHWRPAVLLNGLRAVLGHLRALMRLARSTAGIR